jgi:hypothetical protein
MGGMVDLRGDEGMESSDGVADDIVEAWDAKGCVRMADGRCRYQK